MDFEKIGKVIGKTDKEMRNQVLDYIKKECFDIIGNLADNKHQEAFIIVFKMFCGFVTSELAIMSDIEKDECPQLHKLREDLLELLLEDMLSLVRKEIKHNLKNIYEFNELIK